MGSSARESPSSLTGLNGSEHRGDAGELRVKIAGVGSTSDLRFERRLDPLRSNIIPIDVSEERLTHNLLCVSRPRA